MKYLKLYNESTNNNLKQDIYELLSELKDNNYIVTVYDQSGIEIFIDNTKKFKLSDIKSDIERLIQYMFENYYDISVIIIGYENHKKDISISKGEFNVIETLFRYKHIINNMEEICIIFKLSK